MSNNWIPDEDPLIPLTVARAEDINRRYENVVSAMDRLPEPAASGKGFAPPVNPEDPVNRQFVMDVMSSGEDAFLQANRAETEADRAEAQADLADQHRIAALNSQNSAAGSASTVTTQAGIATTQAGIATTQAGNATNEADRARDEADRSELEADRAQGFANGLNLPSATGNGGKYLKQKSDETGFAYADAVDLSGDQTISGVKTFATKPNVNGDDVATEQFALNNDLGVGQTWQDVTASRSVGVTYTNNTGKPIEVCIYVFVSSSATAREFRVATFGTPNIALFRWPPDGAGRAVNVTIPNGWVYAILGGSGKATIDYWHELR